MKKETLGAALFFCGLGMILTLCDPFNTWFIRVLIGSILMLIGLKMGGC